MEKALEVESINKDVAPIEMSMTKSIEGMGTSPIGIIAQFKEWQSKAKMEKVV